MLIAGACYRHLRSELLKLHLRAQFDASIWRDAEEFGCRARVPRHEDEQPLPPAAEARLSRAIVCCRRTAHAGSRGSIAAAALRVGDDDALAAEVECRV